MIRCPDIEREIAHIFDTGSLDTVFVAALDVVRHTLESRFGFFPYLREDGAWVFPALPEDIGQAYGIACDELCFAPGSLTGPWRTVHDERRTVLENTPHHTPVGLLLLRRSMGAPIVFRNQLVGSLHVADKTSDYTANDLETLKAIAGFIAPRLAARLEIARRERAEADLRQAMADGERREAMLRCVLDAFPDRLCILDQEGRILDSHSEAGAEVIGPKEQLIGRHVSEVLPAPIGDRLISELHRVHDTRQPRSMEFSLPDSGRERRFEARLLRACGDRVIVAARDITERTRIESALRQSEARFRAMSDASPLGLFVSDADGEFLYTNAAFQQLIRLSAEATLGRGWSEAIHPDDRPRLLAQWRSDILARRAFSNELHFRHSDGSAVWIQVNLAVMLDGDSLLGFVGVVEEISERKRYEAELVRAREAALASSRLKTQFLANMSHEIRTPMNAIVGMAELLSATDLSPDQARYVQIFQKAGEDLLKLIDDILDLSRAEAGQLALEQIDFDLVALVEQVAELMVLHARRKGLELLRWIDPDAPQQVRGDPTRLKQVLINLMSNAVKFTGQGEVTLRLERVPQTPHLVRFVVSDTGIGIPEDKRDLLFANFSQVDSSTTRRYGGSGLGLAISRKLVDLMGGTIELESRPGEGSTFSVIIPLEPAREASSPPAAPPNASRGLRSALLTGPGATPPSGGPAGRSRPPGGASSDASDRSLRILLAEDVEDNRSLIQFFLAETPHHLDTVDNGEAALRLAGGTRYDLILMDIQMPILDGYTATREIRRLEAERGLSPVPIIALTAHAFPDAETRSLEAGCTLHLTKPIRRDALFRAVRQFSGSAGPGGKIGEPIPVRVDPMLAELIPRFLANRRRDIDGLRAAVAQGDLATVRRVGHSLKGVGGSFGFPRITELGKELEELASKGEPAVLRALIDDLEDYLRRIEIVRS